jgi:hypothetical protein
MAHPLKTRDFNNCIYLNYFFDFTLGAVGFLGAGATAADPFFTSSNSTSKMSVAPPEMMGGLPWSP